MAHYHKLGSIPKKRHVTYYKDNGELYAEQLISSEGFSSEYTLTYHHYPPTLVTEIEEAVDVSPDFMELDLMVKRNFSGFDVKPGGDFLTSRQVVLGNQDLYIALAAPNIKASGIFYKNSQAHEMVFIHKGKGVLKTMLGHIDFVPGDHLIIPKGIIYQMEFEGDDNRLFIVESFSPFHFPKRYLSNSGQLLENAPIYERDIRRPERLESIDELGDYKVLIKRDDKLYTYHYESHPFDVVGWDGCYYPYALSIHEFEPITGRIHQPPPVHQTWEAHNFVTCAFVPRLFDYHPQAIPAPYNHANLDSDEVLYYVDGDFMSRNNIEKGQITLHPMGVAHGPHPGAVQRSIGQKETQELAVMVDTFKPLKITKQALNIEVKDYYKSWKS
ncbi:homogentisate 1,2-dioxygenase [Lentimicrobium sp. L6]|uniref:homogentisate 1,2-dioxygenase n=1 Tax=Lentimicrobium sp. L6 TaxID=2735916 RepID=UPI0015554EA6|nr:homogentisate 1,2-dioxygenase [Lentimicrobium sp. L6]NPD83761.1 homogentisate 1,2-dioxygenase [Lentimicrobium sp. L6]